YHGYWPVSNIRVDHRFGTSGELRTLLNDAHQRNENVILDYVANHVHITHPIYQKHKDWATSLYLPDGTKNTEKWDEYRLTTWFDDHLPTLDLRRWEIVDPMADSALFWVTEYDFDGFRHDATKHIDELYWRTLTYRVRKNTDRPVLQIGETYGSPQLINSYISTGMMDAQFDFNLYDAAVNTFASSDGDLEALQDKLHQGLQTYGYHHLMGNITGNQDRSRFISLASGEVLFAEDQKMAGWDRVIGKPGADAYKRLALLHAFNNAVPGIPCIYYGDEYGMPGGGDPDNRRMMQFNGLDKDETTLLEKVKKLNQLRSNQLPLIYGTTITRIHNGTVLEIRRTYFDEQVIVFINTSEEKQNVQIQAGPETTLQLHFNGGNVTNVNSQTIPLQLPPLGFEYVTLKQTQP
ncbi:MAG: alpha-amylase family glycosyl hydrolase, partial [Owenweeksia sp.]